MQLPILRTTFLASWLGIVGMLSLGGCGQRVDRPDVEYVEGLVTLDGRPLEAATVGLSPVSGGLPAYGNTDAAGVFRLTSSRGGLPGTGAVAGDYRVTIRKMKDEDATAASTAAETEPPAEPSIEDYERWLKEQKQDARQTPRVTSLVPERYTNPETSGLTASIVAGRNRLEFNLTSD